MKRKIPSPRRESNTTTPTFQPVAQCGWRRKYMLQINSHGQLKGVVLYLGVGRGAKNPLTVK
jgi:hypothetical protein